MEQETPGGVDSQSPYRLETLGRVDLIGPEGASADRVLHQPKRLAVLVYLAVAHPGAFCRRDTVLGIFWPEFDQERARAALRKALHFLRRELGDGVIVTRGDEEVGVDPERLHCDVRAFDTAAGREERERALGLYQGGFLDGFHIGDAVEFERWRDETAEGLRRDAVRTAERATQEAMAAGEPHAAARAADTWTRLAPYDEDAARTLMAALEAAGDRTGALQAYEALERRLRDLDVEPSEQTKEAAEAIRSRSSPPAAGSPARINPAEPKRRRVVPVTVGATVLGVVAVAAFAGRPGAADDRTTVTVHAFENLTGDPALDPIGSVYRRAAVDGVTLVPGVHVPAVDRSGTSDITVSGSYHRLGDTLVVAQAITDRTRGRVLPTPPPVRVEITDPTAGTGELQRRVRAAVAYYTFTWHPTNPTRRPPDWEAYVTFQQAFYTLLGWMSEPDVIARADSLLRRVLELDPQYSEAYYLLGNWVFAQQQPAVRRAAYYQRGRPDAQDSLASVMRTRLAPMTRLDRAIANGLEAHARADYASVIRWSLEEAIPSRPNPGILVASGASNRPDVALAHVAELGYSDWIFDLWIAWWYLAASHHLAGDYAGEAAVVDSARTRPYLRYDFLLEKVRAHTALGDLARVRGLTQNLYFGLAHFGGLELRAHGLERNDAEMLTESDRLLNWLVQRYWTQPESASRNLIFYWALFATGQVDELVPRLERMARDSSHLLDIPGMVGAIYARVGNVAGADSIDRVLADADPSGLRGLVSLWRARIAAQLGEKDRAVQLLDQALREGTWFQPNMPVDGGFWHTDPHFEPLRDYPPYQRLLAPKQ